MGRKYRYTEDSGVLTDYQRAFYDRNGFILIKNNVSHELLDETRQRFIDICDGKVPGFMTVMKDPSLKNKGVKGEYLINKIQDFVYDDVLFKYISHKPVTDVVNSIIGPNVSAVHSMFINKPPDSDPNASLHPLHQDLHYFPFRPADRIVASWTAVERVDESNGCLYVVPASHKGGELYKHEYPEGYQNKLYHGVQGLDYLTKQNVVMEKGDTVFFHPLLLHGSGPNRTKGFRKAISCHYADNNCHFIDVTGTSQENIAHEVMEISAKRGFKLNFVDVWKSKSRLVTGVPGNFQTLSSHL